MAYRYTNTDKWSDAWFSELRPIEKLLFNYLCDNCDIAGFIEVTPKKWAVDIGTDKNQIEGALKGLARGLIYSISGDCIYIRTFLKHQKNLPINVNNKAHLGIIYRFNTYLYKFGFTDYNNFIEGACKGLFSPTGNGNGNGNGNDKGIGEKDDNKEDTIITEFSKFNSWLKKECPNVSKLKTQMTEEQMNFLIAKYTKERFFDILLQMENKKDLNNKYTSVYLTANNWLKR
jgi:hypothetical protein